MVNENDDQPLTTAVTVAPLPPSHAFHPTPAQAPVPPVGKSVENKLNEVTPWGRMVSTRGTWNFVNRCWEGCSRKHPGPCFKVKCPAKEKCSAIMYLPNLWKHMQKVHKNQEFNLRCPSCGVDISCSALDAHMMANHNHCKANTQLFSVHWWRGQRSNVLIVK